MCDKMMMLKSGVTVSLLVLNILLHLFNRMFVPILFLLVCVLSVYLCFSSVNSTIY